MRFNLMFNGIWQNLFSMSICYVEWLFLNINLKCVNVTSSYNLRNNYENEKTLICKPKNLSVKYVLHQVIKMEFRQSPS